MTDLADLSQISLLKVSDYIINHYAQLRRGFKKNLAS